MKSDKQNAAQGHGVIKIPKMLVERVESHCNSRGITPQEFVIEAVSEKLASIHKEKRKKQRL